MVMDLEDETLTELPQRFETSIFQFSPVSVHVTQVAVALNAVGANQHAEATNYSSVEVG